MMLFRTFFFLLHKLWLSTQKPEMVKEVILQSHYLLCQDRCSGVLVQVLLCREAAHSTRLIQWALKIKIMIFRPILGPAHVWDSFLVSHIKVEGKYNFSSLVRTLQAWLLGFWVVGHVAGALIWQTTGFDSKIWVFRWWLYGWALMMLGLQTVIGIIQWTIPAETRTHAYSHTHTLRQ